MPIGSSDWLKKYLRRRSLSEPDGRMLCLYRTTDEELEVLESALSFEISQCSNPTSRFHGFAPGFCIFTAEWWRRNHEAGPWSWDGALSSLGLDPDLPRQRIYPLVFKGLRYWKRQILRAGGANEFLVTLACEGGLPLKLLQKEGARLRNYFRALLREYQVFGPRGGEPAEIAARVSSYLPRSLRHEVVYQLSGSLVEKVWELQVSLGETSSPIEDLDRRDPQWRDRLPLVLSEETARALLNNLVTEAIVLASQSARELKVQCHLKKVDGQYQLIRTIRLPTSLDNKTLAGLLGKTTREVPYRLELYLQAPKGPDLIALLTRRTIGEEGIFAVEIPKGRVPAMEGMAACSSIRLYAKAERHVFPIREIRGGGYLSELPWVFVAKKDDPSDLTFIGEGTVRTRFPDAYIAIETNVLVNAEDGGAAEVFGLVPEVNRLLIRVSGTVSFQSGENVSRIRTGAIQDEFYQYILEGNFLSTGAYDSAVYLGFPRLSCYTETGIRRRILDSEIQWAMRGSGHIWRSLSEESFGPISIRHSARGEIKYLAHVEVVPVTSQVKFVPGADNYSGVVCLEGFHRPEVGVTPQAGLHIDISQDSGSDIYEVKVLAAGEPPPSFAVNLRWFRGGEITLSLPFPARGGRFLGRDGMPLGSSGVVHVDRLGGVVAQILVPHPNKKYLVEGALKARDIPIELANALWLRERMTEVTPGRHELDLRILQGSCRLMFAMTEDLDAEILVSLYSETSEQLPRRLRVAQYEGFLEIDEEAGNVILPDEEAKRVGADAIAALELRAFPMWNPAAEQELLSRVNGHCWYFDPEKRQPGPWLITGWDGDWCRLRPHCWMVPAISTLDSIDGENSVIQEGLSLEEAVKLSDTETRATVIDAIVTRIASDPNAPDWELVDCYIDHLIHLPPTTFDVVSRLARNPGAAALSILRARDDRFDSVWTSLEKLPFSWALIPVSSWVKAASLRYKAARDALVPLASELGSEIEPILDSLFQTFCTQAPLRIPGMQCIAEIIRERVLGRPREECRYLQLAVSSQGSQFFQGLQEEAKQGLLQSHSSEQWPGGGGIEDWMSRQNGVPIELKRLKYDAAGVIFYRAAVLNAPICAAVAAVCGIQMPRELLFHVRRIREFDAAWFDAAYGCALAMSIAHHLKSGSEFPS